MFGKAHLLPDFWLTGYERGRIPPQIARTANEMNDLHDSQTVAAGNGPAVATELQIRRLTFGDLDKVRAVHASIPFEDRSDAWDTFVAWYSAAERMGSLGSEWEGSVIAEWQGEPAGFLLMHRNSHDSVHLRSQRMMVAAVDPKHWRKGVGKAMAEFAVEACKRRGIQVVQSVVPDVHPGHSAFLEHCGFSPVTRRLHPNGVRVYERLLD